MSNQKSLVIRPGSSLAKANRQITIANKALAEIDGERWVVLASRHPDAFIWAITENYQLDEQLIELFEDRWNWCRLIDIKSFPWSESLIERYVDRWDWSGIGISDNKSLPWPLSFVEFFDKNGHCPTSSILGELLQDLDRKTIVQILEAIEQVQETCSTTLVQDGNFDDRPF